jgi:epoxyqueuosine reductase
MHAARGAPGAHARAFRFFAFLVCAALAAGRIIMQKEEFRNVLLGVFRECPGIRVSEEEALVPEAAGMKLFDEPLIGFASADDGLWDHFLEPEAIGPWFMRPGDWLPGARTVVSLFLPFTEHVRESNRKDPVEPSPEWLHGRIQGQDFICAFDRAVIRKLGELGISACAPAVDARFASIKGGVAGDTIAGGGYEGIGETTFSSNWSERHAAYVCGLGTFGLSKGLITSKGIAGRFCSFIIDAEFEPDGREYTGLYDYCAKCGACARRCPAHAITLEEGKKHPPCSAWLNMKKEKYAPYYGCGKCQTGVPCEAGIPGRKRRT